VGKRCSWAKGVHGAESVRGKKVFVDKSVRGQKVFVDKSVRGQKVFVDKSVRGAESVHGAESVRGAKSVRGKQEVTRQKMFVFFFGYHNGYIVETVVSWNDILSSRLLRMSFSSASNSGHGIESLQADLIFAALC
jgi:hypothetical protein